MHRGAAVCPARFQEVTISKQTGSLARTRWVGPDRYNHDVHHWPLRIRKAMHQLEWVT